MVKAGKPCPRGCGGQIFENDDGAYCLQCGWQGWWKVTTAELGPVRLRCRGRKAGCTSSVHNGEPSEYIGWGRRKQQVYALLDKGLTNQQISDQLNIEGVDVSKYRRNHREQATRESVA